AARSPVALTSNLHLKSDFESMSDSTKRNGSRSFCERLRSNATLSVVARNNESDDHRRKRFWLAAGKTEGEGRRGNCKYGLPNMNAQIGRIGGQGESQDESQGESQNQRGPIPRAAGGKKHKRDVHGWLVLDKPVGMTSTHAVSVIKH